MFRWLSLCVLLFAACAKDQEHGHAMSAPRQPARLLFNEAAPRGTGERNEFGEKADHLELFNAGEAITLEPGAWFISDAPADPMRYELPSVFIAAHGYLLVWCDDVDVDGQQAHAGFKLSNAGEHLSLWHLREDALELVDSITLIPHTRKGCTQGHPSDAPSVWRMLAEPTPGHANSAALSAR